MCCLSSFSPEAPSPTTSSGSSKKLLVPRTLQTGDFLQRAGDVSKYTAFISKGCLRSYSIDAKGNEHIVQFAAETYWLGDAASLTTGAPSQLFIQALSR
jgi:CRP-like cAMP-binding protein